MKKTLKADVPRKFGIESVGVVPWGTHLCQFYESKEDLIEILVPYFAEGLRSNEFCIWVASDPLEVEEAKKALRKAVPNLDEYVKKGQIEIFSYADWYILDGKFDSDRVLRGWVKKEKEALSRGFDGLRLTGNTFWLERNCWKSFTNYEADVNSAIVKYRMIALCTYSLERCTAKDMVDVVRNHVGTLIRKEGKWCLVEDSSERKKAEQALQRYSKHLEELVEERTDELKQINETLQKEIAERKQTEEKLRSASLYVRSLIEASLDPLVTISAEGKITDVNNATELATGCSREELIGSDFSDYFTEPEKARAGYVKVFTEGLVRDYPLAIRHKSGKITHVLYNATVYRNEAGEIQGVFAAARDVTERKQAEEKLRAASLYSRSLIEASLDPLVTISAEGKITDVNKATEEVTGFSRDQLIGSDFSDYFTEPEKAREGYRQVFTEGFIKDYPLAIRHKSGKVTDVLYHATVYRNEAGEVQGVFAAARDVTEKKKLEAQFLRAQRMESLGTLAGGIAHDLNNVLTPIMLSIELLERKYVDEESRKLLAILERNVKRGADLTKQILLFARGSEGERQPIQVKQLISEIEKTIKETFPRNIDIRTEVSSVLRVISGDATQLHQVLMNLCLNARDAMLQGGTLNISAENAFIDENYAHMNIDAKVGPYLIVSVSDTGTGIPPGVMDRIFDPFFTTKKQGEGTGLGLSTSLAIVKSHSGFINVYSEVGKGSIFKVYLPSTALKEKQEAERQLELPIGQGETILVVDDEELIRDITTATLEANGYKSLTASDGAEAVALYARNMDNVQIVLLDIMMPIMDGQACIRALRKINPQVKIIACSGLAENGRNRAIAGTANAFLTKPYTAEKLLKTIRNVLTRNPS